VRENSKKTWAEHESEVNTTNRCEADNVERRHDVGLGCLATPLGAGASASTGRGRVTTLFGWCVNERRAMRRGPQVVVAVRGAIRFCIVDFFERDFELSDSTIGGVYALVGFHNGNVEDTRTVSKGSAEMFMFVRANTMLLCVCFALGRTVASVGAQPSSVLIVWRAMKAAAVAVCVDRAVPNLLTVVVMHRAFLVPTVAGDHVVVVRDDELAPLIR